MRRVLALILMAGLGVSGCSFTGDDAEGAKRQKPVRPNVVLIIFDEFGGDILLGPDGRIDAGRFPHFAALARDGTWFRNAQTRYDSTTKAVPLILDGQAPRPKTAPNVRDHPQSIFTALGGAGYRIVTSEEATAMCPRRYCPHERAKQPAIIPNLKGGRAERFERFIRTIHASSRPTLWMKHALLPHGPWVYLPDGRMSRPPGPELLPGMQTIPGFYDDYLRHHNEQRQLLQLGFADRLLGRMIARLKRAGIYDDTMVVVTADHGFAWKVGVDTRRNVSLSNIDELGSVPMIVKRPRQRVARVSGALAQTLDVTPTIADVLNVPLGYRADGRSMFTRAVARRRTVRIVKRDFSSVVSISKRRWVARRGAVVRRRLRELGSGNWPSLFTSFGPRPDLIGQRVADLRAASGVRATLSLARSFRQVRPAGGVVPCQIAGRIRGSSRAAERDIAIAVNGRIAAVGRSFHLRGEKVESYSVMVPEDALREGRNTVEVLEVEPGGRMALLARG
ncbi:MAG TPA: sulfatase-like hydrolase/transferase [Thermoleophilaceae bacterium]|nr:sulfatase-like hydrolase/transferase [Thermoleophilaceae bacterium]